MISLNFVWACMAVLCIWSTLPTATQCDTSYYEKYYSARRFLPLKKTSQVQVNFTVSLGNEMKLEEFEQLALVGSVPALGSWKANGAVFMNKTEEYGKWQASVWLSANSSFSYRYFIAARATTQAAVQIRRWESAIHSRAVNLTYMDNKRYDNFGLIGENKATTVKEIQRGWLNSGHIVQFKLFRNPLLLNDTASLRKQRLRIKLTPVDPQWRTAIVPSARAFAEYVRFEYGNSFLGKQPEHGVLYQDKDIIMYHITVSDLENVAYLWQVYVEDAETNVARIIGSQYIYRDALTEPEGDINVNLLSTTWLSTIGTLKLKYVIINPLASSSSLVDFHTTFTNYWRSEWSGLEAGHRGLGKSLKETTNSAPIVENTVASMIAAGELGTDLVEFDVQLTKDLVPIIYHDFAILVCMESKTPTSKADLTEVLIKDVTYDQLKDLTTYQVIGTKIIEYPSHNSLANETHRLFPTFEDFLTKVNKTIGFDIEIKWPQLKSNGVWESVQTIDKNVYIDRILEVMLKHGCGRLSFFTSFDADICTLLRFKQNMYPVMFLSSSKEANFVDPRSDTIYDTVNTAQAFDYAGIVPNAVFIRNKPEWVDVALRQNKKIFLWGAELKDRDAIDWFKAQNPTGVIYDRMDLYLTANRTSAFDKTADLPAFFELQCAAPSLGAADNANITNILSNVNML